MATQAKADPLDYMNRLMKWPTLESMPPTDDRWLKKIADACNLIANRDDEIAALKKAMRSAIRRLHQGDDIRALVVLKLSLKDNRDA